MPGGYWTAVG